jgi:hypothetical protein
MHIASQNMSNINHIDSFNQEFNHHFPPLSNELNDSIESPRKTPQLKSF